VSTASAAVGMVCVATNPPASGDDGKCIREFRR
jgi:hypothetical protein